MQPTRIIQLKMHAPLPSVLLRLFQKGVQTKVVLGISLMELLTKELCLSDEGIELIQTIFWNGKPVDDLEDCSIAENGILALSAALPGLVGACMRRGGAWAPLRDSISHQQTVADQAASHGLITIKLFNFMLQEVGPLLLKRGVVIDSSRFNQILEDETFQNNVITMEVNGIETNIEQAKQQSENSGTTLLQIK